MFLSQLTRLVFTKNTLKSLSIKTRGRIPNPYFLFLTYKRVQKARELYYAWLENLVSEKQSRLLCPFISNAEMKHSKYYTVFITLHFLNLRMGPISQRVILHWAGKCCQGDTLKAIEFIHK
jgi:hypothetical protein